MSRKNMNTNSGEKMESKAIKRESTVASLEFLQHTRNMQAHRQTATLISHNYDAEPTTYSLKGRLSASRPRRSSISEHSGSIKGRRGSVAIEDLSEALLKNLETLTGDNGEDVPIEAECAEPVDPLDGTTHERKSVILNRPLDDASACDDDHHSFKPLFVDGMIHPDSRFRSEWDVYIALIVMWVAIVTPMSIAFDLNDPGIIVFDTVIDISFWLHIGLNFRTAIYKDYSMKLETRPSQVAINYLKCWFWIDLVATIPLDDLIKIMLGNKEVAGVTRSGGTLKLLRLLRLSRLLRVANISKIQVTNQYYRLAKLAGIILALAHWAGCIWWMIAEFSYFQSNFGPSIHMRFQPTAYRYLVSLYWGLTSITTLGGTVEPENEGEILFSIIVVSIGIFVFAYIIGSMYAVIQGLELGAARYQELMAEVTEWMKFRKFPDKQRKRIKEYFDKIWVLNKGLDEERIMNYLPHGLRLDISKFMHRALLEKVPIFHGCTPGFLNTLSTMLRAQVCLHNDFIIREGEMGSDMYFLKQGTLAVFVGRPPKQVCELTDGAFFGEIALLSDVPRTASVKAKSFSELFILGREEFDSVVACYADMREIISEIAQQRLAKDKIDDEDNSDDNSSLSDEDTKESSEQPPMSSRQSALSPLSTLSPSSTGPRSSTLRRQSALIKPLSPAAIIKMGLENDRRLSSIPSDAKK